MPSSPGLSPFTGTSKKALACLFFFATHRALYHFLLIIIPLFSLIDTVFIRSFVHYHHTPLLFMLIFILSSYLLSLFYLFLLLYGKIKGVLTLDSLSLRYLYLLLSYPS